MTSCVQKITFVLSLVISDVIVALVSNQCPQGPPNSGNSPNLNVEDPQVHKKTRVFYESV